MRDWRPPVWSMTTRTRTRSARRRDHSRLRSSRIKSKSIAYAPNGSTQQTAIKVYITTVVLDATVDEGRSPHFFLCFASHSRAIFCALAIWAGVMRWAARSRFIRAFLLP